MFTGVYTALVTPFKDGKIDYDALEKIIEMQIAGGVDGVVPMGSTGESPAVSMEEHKEFLETVVKLVNGRVKVIAGSGSNSTKEAIHLTTSAEEYGVDGCLVVNPYYNKPPQRALISHFAAVANSVKIPIILYNIPGRTGVNLLPESVKTLADQCENIVAIKEASGNIAQMMRVKELCGNRLSILSGDDNLLLPLLAVGGDGVISVVSNLFPKDVKQIINDFKAGNIEAAQKHFYKLLPLCREMFSETNPIPVKAAMNMMGYCEAGLRMPLVELAEDKKVGLRAALENYGVAL